MIVTADVVARIWPAGTALTGVVVHRAADAEGLNWQWLITLRERYKKVRNRAWAEYHKVCDPALAEYEKVHGPALADVDKVCNPAWDEYEKVRIAALAKIWNRWNRVRR